MGRVTTQSPAAPPSLKHFTHPHNLHPLPLNNPQTLCTGCNLPSNGIMYTCTPCNFTLHQSCAKLPQHITHPSHPGCTLSLLTVSSYAQGIFSCNACNHRGDSWNYHCAACEYDLHVTCASRPLKIRTPSHGSCELQLTFKNPYPNSTGFSCDVCRKIGSKQWLYRCSSCEFDAHLECAGAPRPTLQHTNSAPALALHQLGMVGGNVMSTAPPQVALPPQPYLLHSASTGSIGINPYGGNLYDGGPVNPGQPAGNPQMMMALNQPQKGGSSLGGNMMAAALSGFVEGAVQGLGQAVVQDVISTGGGAEYFPL